MDVKEWLGDDNQLGVDIWQKKYRYNNESFDEWLDRVSGGDEEVRKLIKEKKFLFGGRTLANRGTGKKGSMANCYSRGFVGDALEDLMDANTDIALTFKSQGGQGISLSHLRPAGCGINKGQFKSDGIIPFMEIYNRTTESISQGGCIAEYELVQTETGYKRIKDVKKGDKVWTKIGFVEVDDVIDKGMQEVIHITTKRGYEITTTPDHKFAIDGFNKKPIKDINVGECVNLIEGALEDSEIDCIDYHNLVKEAILNENIPNTIISLNDKKMLNFLSELDFIYNDGMINVHNPYLIKDKEYALTLLKLFSRIGCFPKLSTSILNGTESYKLEVFNEDYNRVDLSNSKIETQAELIYDTVISKEDAGVQHVYDLVLSKEHMFNCNGFYVSNSRKGALIMTLDIWHKEAEKFITIKSEEGKIQKANLSLEIDDEFMECVKTYYTTGEVIKKEITRDYEGNKITYEVVPIELYKLMMQKAYDWAEPGCIYTNRFRNYNLMELDDEYNIETANPCFGGDEEILTSEGYKKFKDLENTEPLIYNANGELVKSKIWCSGEKETVKVKLANGKEIICTPDHRFMLSNGTECKAADLAGNRIMLANSIQHDYDKTFIKLGFIQGDGELSTLSSVNNDYVIVNAGVNDNDIRMLFSDDKIEIPDWKDKSERVFKLFGYNELIKIYEFSLTILPDRVFPRTYDEWSIKQKSSFLCGCYSANGCVIHSNSDNNFRIGYKTTCKEFAEKLKETLQKDFGIAAYITTNKPNKIKFDNGEYLIKESYDVNIARLNSIVSFLVNIGFYQYYKQLQLSDVLKRGVYVYSVTPFEKMKVYDFTEPNVHWGIVDDCVVHNCGRIACLSIKIS